MEKTLRMEEMNPTYFQVLLLFFPWNFLSPPPLHRPSILIVRVFEIAGVWLTSGSSAIARVCLFFKKYLFKRKT